MSELLDIVDENNVPTGKTMLRNIVHSNGQWHRAIHVYIYRKEPNLQLLINLRSKTKDLCPNRWDTRIGGHLKAGETVDECVTNELEEEVGLKPDAKHLTQGPIYKCDTFPNREFSYQFYYEFNGDENSIKFNDGEVQAIRWLDIENIKSEMKESPDSWASKRVFKDIERDLKAAIANKL